MRIKWTLIIVLFTVILIHFPACNQMENLTNSGSKLIVETITGTDLDGNEASTTIFSDVMTSSGSIFNDVGAATLSAQLLDPTETESTYYQDIIVDQIDVEYSRSDMPDALQGVDVPFSFSQKVYARVPVGGTVDLSFVTVQHNAKSESPLVELVNITQEKVLKMEARCTFYGHDVAGNRIAPVTGSVSVWFSNFADTN